LRNPQQRDRAPCDAQGKEALKQQVSQLQQELTNFRKEIKNQTMASVASKFSLRYIGGIMAQLSIQDKLDAPRRAGAEHQAYARGLEYEIFIIDMSRKNQSGLGEKNE
jgi:hypothetical protein